MTLCICPQTFYLRVENIIKGLRCIKDLFKFKLMCDVIAQHIFNNCKLQENIKVSTKEENKTMLKKIKYQIGHISKRKD
jgi:hypothetical protein